MSWSKIACGNKLSRVNSISHYSWDSMFVTAKTNDDESRIRKCPIELVSMRVNPKEREEFGLTNLRRSP